MTASEMDLLCINTIRTLAIDAILKASPAIQAHPWAWRLWPMACGKSN